MSSTSIHPLKNSSLAKWIAAACLLLSFGLLFGVASAGAQGGALDPSFGSGGIVTTAIGADARIESIALQPNGDIVAGGESEPCYPNCDSSFTLARYHPDGSLDPTFGTQGIAKTTVGLHCLLSDLAIQQDGKIVVVGTAYYLDGTSAFALARYTPDGSLDPTFGTGGVVTTTIEAQGLAGAAGVTLQPNGKIVVVGSNESPDLEHSQVVLARYDADGSLDHSFGTAGLVTASVGPSDRGQAVGLQPDGKIVVAGAGNLLVARFHADGSLDDTFGRGGMVGAPPGSEISAAYGIALQPDGKILVATIDGLFRYDANGSRDSTFGQNGIVTAPNPYFAAVAVRPDGKIVGAGTAFTLARYKPDGSLDQSFGIGGSTTLPGVGFGAIRLTPDGKVVGGGVKGRQFALARFLQQGYALAVKVKGSGRGVVTSTPADITCPTSCFAPEAPGAVISFHVRPAKGSVFSGWAGACSGKRRCSLTMRSNHRVVAHFSRCVVPGVRGRKLTTAKKMIRHAHCSVGKISRKRSRILPPGRVLRQYPRAHSKRPAGTKVRLQVSRRS